MENIQVQMHFVKIKIQHHRVYLSEGGSLNSLAYIFSSTIAIVFFYSYPLTY